MRIYAITQDLKLEIYPSKKAFIDQADAVLGWCDRRYIRVATMEDILDTYTDPYVQRGIVNSDKEITAHNMLYCINQQGGKT